MAEGSRETTDSSSSSPDFEGDDEESKEPAEAEPAKRRKTEDRDSDKAPEGGDAKTEKDQRDTDPPGEATAPASSAPSAVKEEVEDSAPWVPERVQKALEKSSTFDEFRKNRPFRYLHLFSGERDQLGISIKEEAKRARLEVYVESLDRKKDSELNLASHVVYDEIDKSVSAGEWDGYHSGFPCSSFSRVRWREAPYGAQPVRSAEQIYGLRGNTKEQQKEADEGTLMAVRSAWLHQHQVESFKRRSVPEISTLENPPGHEQSGSAWDLPELQAVVQASTLDWQAGEPHFFGKGMQMPTVGTTCTTGGETQHGGSRGLPRRAHCTDCQEDCRIMETHPELEWLRYQMKEKTNKINELQIKWLENEERRRKRVYDEAEPSNVNPLSKDPKSRKVTTKATEAKESETENMPSSSAGPSKKLTREEENDFAIGGMRNPAISVSRLHQVANVGRQIHEAWLDFVTEHPEALKAAEDYGSKEAKLLEDVTHMWRQRLETLLDMKEPDGITLREEVEFKPPLHGSLWDAWRVASRDPEQFIGQWAREGVPLGMECEVPPSGIFPSVEAEDPLDTQMDMTSVDSMKNYESVESQKDEAEVEIDRYIECGFCKILPLEEIHKRFPKGTASKLALIIKQKPDGSTKRRIVIDMKRSQGNNRAKVTERIVLPRAQDIVNSLRVMRAREHELKEEKTTSVLKGSRSFEEAAIEFMLIDLQDAFCHFGVHPKELRHCVSPGLHSGTGILWTAMLFGYKAAPLVMSRLSATVGRLVQSLFHPAAGQVQVYIDDVALIVRGTRHLRNMHLAKVLYVLAAFGVRVAMQKGERGRWVQWIGTTFELQPHKLILGTPRKMIMEIKETLAAWENKGMIPTKDLRSFLGKLAWVAGIVPRLRWTVATMYAVLTKTIQDERLEAARAQKRPDTRPKFGLVATKRMGTALPWLRAAFETPERMLIRHEPLVLKDPVWGIVTDASPRGLGGLIIHRVGTEWNILEAFEAPMTPDHAAALEIEFQQASGQAVLEGLAVLRALQIWSRRASGGPL
eukprot:s2755_g5.t1